MATSRPTSWQAERLSLPLAIRLPFSITLASFAGFALGTYKGSEEHGLRFRAENAHRFPTTQTGWFLYHKSKNYHMALGGIKEGFRMAWRQGFWVGVFMGTEECIDRGRAGVARAIRGVEDGERAITGNRDFLSSVLAGLSTAGLFSVWNRFPVPTAARVAKMGIKAGLGYGLLQDAVSIWRGRRLGYVEFVKRQLSPRGTTTDELMHAPAEGEGL